jgi:hypothetical protein
MFDVVCLATMLSYNVNDFFSDKILVNLESPARVLFTYMASEGCSFNIISQFPNLIVRSLSTSHSLLVGGSDLVA